MDSIEDTYEQWRLSHPEQIKEEHLRRDAALTYGVDEADVTETQMEYVCKRRFWNDKQFWEALD